MAVTTILSKNVRAGKLAVLLGVLAGAAVFLTSSPALAVQSPAPAWQVTTAAIPTVLPAGLGRHGTYEIAIENIGGLSSSGELTVKDVLPAGFTVTNVLLEAAGSCPQASGSEVVCKVEEAVVPSGFVVLSIDFEVTGSVGDLTNAVSVSGGGVASPAVNEVSMRRQAVGETGPGPAGVAEAGFQLTGPAGEPFTQAGGHPNFLTTTLLLNTMYNESVLDPRKPVEPVKDLSFYMPLGMLGNAAVTEPCPPSLVQIKGELSGCPSSSRVGTVLVMILDNFFSFPKDPTHQHPLWSMAPEKGYAAEFAFGANGLSFYVYANVVWHDGAYMIRVSTPGVDAGAQLLGLIATFSGDLKETVKSGPKEIPEDRGAFLTDPTDCGESPQAREALLETDTWREPGVFSAQRLPAFPALEGCELLGFSSMLNAAPDVRNAGDSTEADEPSGYKVSLETPQAPLSGTGLGAPPYKTVDFMFPEGTSLSPGAANGLTACAATGPHGIDFPNGEGTAGSPGTETGEGEEDGPESLPRPSQGHCPSSSQVGTARASTPLLHEELEGHLYLAEPGCGNPAHPNPCTPEDAANGTLYRLYLELEAPNRGVIIKLAGKALVNPQTGRITSVFEGTPQFPVSDLTIETSSGPRASFANPQTCGTATTTGLITPWSGGAPSEPSSSFQVNEGCGAQAFNPMVTAGTISSQAGAFSPFTFTLKREDREQDIKAIATTLPEGLLAAVSKVSQCPEPQASQGACPESSHGGTATVGIGAGTGPYYQTGQVYFTGPYNGAPFGLSVVVPAVAGPFNLGNVVVRISLSINPVTTQASATTDMSGAYAIPQVIDGVPLRIRTMNLTLNNPGFTFNPTSCARQAITGTVYSTQGASTGISVPFEATGCQSLSFKPSLTASTQAKTSKAAGASLVVKVTSGVGQANIAKVDLQLPKQLPARLTTLQKACTEAQFNANPAGCPEASDIGTAKAITPVLNAPLVGPAYLVSHGGAAFPDVEFVLQGEGVRIDLDGGTQIKGAITYSKFESVPDAPISSFETTLPEGPHSVLATDIPASAKNSLCAQSLSMPTTITAQDGAVIRQTTKVAVTGCPKVKSLTRAQKLARALKVCKKKPKSKRAACAKQASKRYGPLVRKKAKGGRVR